MIIMMHLFFFFHLHASWHISYFPCKESFQTVTTADVKEIFSFTGHNLHTPHTAHRKALCSLSKYPQQYLAGITVLLFWRKNPSQLKLKEPVLIAHTAIPHYYMINCMLCQKHWLAQVRHYEMEFLFHLSLSLHKLISHQIVSMNWGTWFSQKSNF